MLKGPRQVTQKWMKGAPGPLYLPFLLLDWSFTLHVRGSLTLFRSAWLSAPCRGLPHSPVTFFFLPVLCIAWPCVTFSFIAFLSHQYSSAGGLWLCLSYSSFCPPELSHCLTHSSCSINICGRGEWNAPGDKVEPESADFIGALTQPTRSSHFLIFPEKLKI